MKTALLLAAVLSLSTISVAVAQEEKCDPPGHAAVPAIQDLAYHQARKLLVSGGWQPVQARTAEEAKTDPDIASGNGPVFWAKGYVELEACSGTGLAPCAFLFKDSKGNRLRVTTGGEEDPAHKVSAKVTGFQFVCE
jgi:hypothetical protein